MTHLPHSDLSGDLSGTGPAPQIPRHETPHHGSALLHLGLAVLPVVAASALGQIATMPNLAPWYASLVKPSFNPPNWIFGPVWTILYVLMAYAFYRILRAPEGAARRTAITVFLVQLALNAAWSWAFFGFRSPLGGVMVILPLLASIIVTIRSFAPVDRPAALLLYPYAAWVSFATLLTISIWWLNG
ncbi:MAG: TspO/MBR family protein [Beijerinckiaceae bacterium]